MIPRVGSKWIYTRTGATHIITSNHGQGEHPLKADGFWYLSVEFFRRNFTPVSTEIPRKHQAKSSGALAR